MAIRPIKLHLDGEEIHLVPKREVDRWTGYINAPRAAYNLVTPENVGTIRQALLTPPWTDTEGVFTELRKQLEDGSAIFFEIPPQPVTFDSPKATDLFDLIPGGGLDDDKERPGHDTGIHWIEVVCVSASGESYAGAKARIRLPDGRDEFVTLDARSSVRFDDLTASGTAHFELSGDATARGTLNVPVGTRYELGAPIGLTTRKKHVLIVHPNPRAFVSVELFVDDEPVTQGAYTLTAGKSDQGGALEGETARAEGFTLPAASTYAFEKVILPPRPAEDAATPSEPDKPAPITPVPTGTDPATHDPSAPDIAQDTLVVTLRLEDGTPIPATLELTHAKDETAQGDEARFDGVKGAGTLTVKALQLPE